MNSTNKLTTDELMNAFNSLETNKSEGLDEININIIKKTFDIIKNHLLLYFYSLTQDR